jgi:hypothetical protein
MEEMMQRLDRRTVVLERTIVDLQTKAASHGTSAGS